MEPKHILVGVTGSIAAYKACSLVSDLSKKGHEVRVVMTQHASAFVSTLTLASLSHHEVYTDEFQGKNEEMIPHIALARWADVYVIVPADANIIAKAVTGIADDLVSSIIPACTCPKLMAAAMNVHMYENAVTQRNLAAARELGWTIIEPDSGMLACQETGKGRLADLETIEEAIFKALEPEKKDLEGKTVLISAGPTQEAFDPVRFISNHSSGKQGYAIAGQALKRGARVILVHGPVSLPDIEGAEMVSVRSARDMQEAVQSYEDQADFIIMAAAVADYRPSQCQDQKIKKNDDSMAVTLVKNPDILAGLGRNKKPGQVLCGFAMETENLDENARKKMESKNCDLLIANNLKTPGAGFQTDTNIVSLLDASGVKHLEKQTKEQLGSLILDVCLEKSKGKQS